MSDTTNTNTPRSEKLRVPQARLLRALMPYDPSWPRCEWPILTRAAMAVRAGYTHISGSINRALNGVSEVRAKGGKKPSTTPHLGAVALGYIDVLNVEVVEGIWETNYRITLAGIAAYQRYLVEGGQGPEQTPEVRASKVNNRYKEQQDEQVTSHASS